MKKITILISLIIIAYSSTFKDKNTNLIWQTNPSISQYTWEEAKKHCNNLSYNYKNDWRLPNIYELMSLTDKTKHNPSIITKKINIKAYDYYWTSSYKLPDFERALNVKFDDWDGAKPLWSKIDIVHFRTGNHDLDTSNTHHFALCVRGKGNLDRVNIY